MTFDTHQLTPHGFCLAWDQTLLILVIVGNAFVWAAYVLIPLQLLIVFARASGPVYITRSRPLIALFAAFIFCCGVSHAVDIVVLWWPWYWLQGVWIGITGAISIATALVMPSLVSGSRV